MRQSSLYVTGPRLRGVAGTTKPLRGHERGDELGRGTRSGFIGDKASEDGSGYEAHVAPEAIHADDRGAVARLYDVGDRGDEGRVNEGRATKRLNCAAFHAQPELDWLTSLSEGCRRG